VLDRDVLITDYIRTINRIRAYFYKNSEHIQSYLLMPTSHRYPEYKWVSSNRSALIVVNGFCFCAFFVLGSFLIRGFISLDVISVILALASFVVSYFTQNQYANAFFKNAEAMARKKETVSLYKSYLVDEENTDNPTP